MTAPSTLLTSAPILPGERIESIDLIRGFAIFGILLVNMQFYNAPFTFMLLNTPWWTGTADRIATWGIRFFAEGKFYPLLSFLFGLGMTLLMARMDLRGISFALVYRRRLFVLLLIGIVHGVLIWAGDILVTYAVLGFFLLLFRTRRPKTVLVWAVICWLFPVLLMGLAALFIEMGRSFPQSAAQIDAAFTEAAVDYRTLADKALTAYAHGTFGEMVAVRARELALQYTGLFAYGPTIFAFFLSGMYAGRRWTSRDLPELLPHFRRGIWWMLAAAIIGNVVFATARESSSMAVPSFMSFLAVLGATVSAPASCFLFVTAAILVARQQAWTTRFSPLAAVGRTAISNYLFQSIVCTTLYNSYGFGLYGQVGPAAGVGITIALFCVQLFLSRWWLERFRFGPVEWLWRSLTYRTLQPMRLGN